MKAPRWSVWLDRIHPGEWTVVRDWDLTTTRAFPSWRVAYDYAHTHPGNRKESTT